MVIRGAGGLTTRIHGARPRRRRPDWDNTIHDLKSLKLTQTELEARAKAFKSRDWTTGTRSSVRSSTKSLARSFSRASSSISVLFRSNSSGAVIRNSSKQEFCSAWCLPGESEFHKAEETTMDAFGRVRVRRAGTAVTLREKKNASPRQATPVITSSDDDFDEDIRRLESLQRQKSHYPSLQEPVEYCTLNTGCADPHHGTLLQYIEREMQKAWSEMCSQKRQANRRAPRRREVRRRVKLQATVRPNACTGVRSLNKVLEKQSSMVLKANQFFIQELQNYVKYQAEVIRELNEFRISAARDLTSLLGRVQKLLAIQERKDLAPLIGRTDEARDALLKIESEEDVQTVVLSPPKPREVPLYLKRRISHVPKDQRSAEARPVETSLEMHKLPAKADMEQLAKAVKGLPVKTIDVKAVDQVSAEPVEPLEAPESVVVKAVEPEKSVPAASPKKVTENKRRLPSADISNSTALAGQPDEFDKRENPLFETEKNRCIGLPRGPYKKSRLQDHHFSSAATRLTSRPASAEATKVKDKAEEAETRAVRKLPTVLCSPKKKPNLEQERQAKSRGIEDKSHRRLEVQLQKPPASAPASKRPVPAGPRLTLHGWSSAFLQPGIGTKLRGKENTAKRLLNRG